eukprot:sb/3476584/
MKYRVDCQSDKLETITRMLQMGNYIVDVIATYINPLFKSTRPNIPALSVYTKEAAEAISCSGTCSTEGRARGGPILLAPAVRGHDARESVGLDVSTVSCGRELHGTFGGKNKISG